MLIKFDVSLYFVVKMTQDPLSIYLYYTFPSLLSVSKLGILSLLPKPKMSSTVHNPSPGDPFRSWSRNRRDVFPGGDLLQHHHGVVHLLHDPVLH